MPSIILASASVRRRELLQRICDDFTVQPANIDETALAGEHAKELVIRLAEHKAQHILNTNPEAIVIGSDTLIECDAAVLGKPESQAHFMHMMKTLSNRQHTVHTAVACLTKDQVLCKMVSSEITFATISEQQALAYWQSGEPQDKAGGYAIQGLGEQFITRINGSYSAVVGLPLYETKHMLETLVKWT